MAQEASSPGTPWARRRLGGICGRCMAQEACAPVVEVQEPLAASWLASVVGAGHMALCMPTVTATVTVTVTVTVTGS